MAGPVLTGCGVWPTVAQEALQLSKDLTPPGLSWQSSYQEDSKGGADPGHTKNNVELLHTAFSPPPIAQLYKKQHNQ